MVDQIHEERDELSSLLLEKDQEASQNIKDSGSTSSTSSTNASRFQFRPLLGSTSSENFNHLRRVAMATVSVKMKAIDTVVLV